MWPCIILTHAQSKFQRVSCLLGRNHCINKSARGRVLSVEISFVGFTHFLHLCFQFVARLFTICSNSFELATENSLNRGFAFHHSHSSGWPTKNEVRIKALTGHRVIARP